MRHPIPWNTQHERRRKKDKGKLIEKSLADGLEDSFGVKGKKIGNRLIIHIRSIFEIGLAKVKKWKILVMVPF